MPVKPVLYGTGLPMLMGLPLHLFTGLSSCANTYGLRQAFRKRYSSGSQKACMHVCCMLPCTVRVLCPLRAHDPTCKDYHISTTANVA